MNRIHFLAISLLLTLAGPSSNAQSPNPSPNPSPPNAAFAKGVWGNWALNLPDGAAGWLTLSNDQDMAWGELWTVGSPKQISDLDIDGQTVRFVRLCKVGEPDFDGGPPTGERIGCLHQGTVTGDVTARESVTVNTKAPLPSRAATDEIERPGGGGGASHGAPDPGKPSIE